MQRFFTIYFQFFPPSLHVIKMFFKKMINFIEKYNFYYRSFQIFELNQKENKKKDVRNLEKLSSH